MLKRLIDNILVTEKGCWEWQGALYKKTGYGKLFDSDYRRGVSLAHRFFYSHYIGYPIPDNVMVLHHCDNPPCVNPKHLFLGNHLINMQDCIAKGRKHHCSGILNHRAILTEAEVLEIRASYIPMVVTTTDLSKKYGVSREQIHSIIARKSWKHI